MTEATIKTMASKSRSTLQTNAVRRRVALPRLLDWCAPVIVAKSGTVLPCGFAAAQCGKALPYRACLLFLSLSREAAPRAEAQPPKSIQDVAGKAQPFRTTGRQSRKLTALNFI